MSTDKETSRVIIAALIVSSALIVFLIFRWEIADIVTPFLMLPIEASIALIFIGIMFWAFIHVCRKKRFKRLKAWAPLLIQAATVIIVLTFPFTAVVVKLDFKLHLEERQEVVSKVIKGELAPYSSDRCSRIDLPEKYHHLTRGGFIKVQKQNGTVYVFFYTFRGILDNFSGFMYRSDDTYPKIGDCGADIKESEKLKKNWYWVASY